MAINASFYDVEKYQLKWLRGLGFESYVCQLCVILIVYYFNNKRLNMMSDNIILGVKESS